MQKRKLALYWNKCENDTPQNWCNLLTVDLTEERFKDFGVYVIWFGMLKPDSIVRVGQGQISKRLAEHRSDSEILKYKRPDLFVTWAKVDSTDCDGVEAFLADRLKPKVGDRFPDKPQIAVNFPFDQYKFPTQE